MRTSISSQRASFLHGAPSCSYDEFYACSQGRSDGALFRLVNNTPKRWYFYNDSTDMLAKVHAIFKPGSSVRALRDSRMTTRQTADGLEWIVNAEVMPCSTVKFIEGEPCGFELEFAFEAAPDRDVVFARSPSCTFDKAYKCFRDTGNGLLFRLVDSARRTWYFHNDTNDTLMTATLTLDAAAAAGVRALAGVARAEGAAGEVTLRQTVPPGATAAFLVGDPPAFRLSFTAEHAGAAAQPLAPADIAYMNGGPDAAVAGPGAEVFRCFAGRGNGLLFRIIDPARAGWDFYNDTAGTRMRVVLWVPHGEGVVAADGVEVAADPARPGTTRLTLVVPPRATRRMLTGQPRRFEMDCVAEPTEEPVPAEGRVFRCGGPDPTVMSYDQVFSAWKGQGGELFRLINTKWKLWGFYNDTKELFFEVHVKFTTDGKLTPLGTTRMVVSRKEDGMWYIVDIPPKSTIKFVQGVYSGFEIKIMGASKPTSRRRTFVTKH